MSPIKNQLPDSLRQYNNWYQQAEAVYYMESPTPEDEKKATILYEKTAASLEKLRVNDSLWADCLIKSANIYQGQGLYKDAIKTYHKALYVNNKFLRNDFIKYEATMYLGSALYYDNVIDSARIYFENAANIANTNSLLPDLGFLYNSLGVIYYESANYTQAINFFEKAVQSTDSTGSEFTETIISFKTNIATCLKLSGKNSDAIYRYSQLLTHPYFYGDQTSVQEIKYKLYYNTANCYLTANLPDSAYWYYSRMESKEDQFTIKRMNDMGQLFLEEESYEKAETYFDSAITLNNKISGSVKNKDRATSYLNRALLAARRGLIDEAIQWCNYALQELHFSFKAKNAADLPTDERKVISPVLFFDVLKNKANFLERKYYATQREADAAAAMQSYMLALKVAHYIRKDFDNDEAHLFFSENNKSIYRKAALLAARLVQYDDKPYIDNLLQVYENYKGNILGNHLRQTEIKSKIENAGPLRDKEINLKQLLAFYTTRLNNLTNPADIESMQERITNLETDLALVQKEFQKDIMYSYYKDQNDAAELTIQNVKKKLHSDAAVVDFMHCDTIVLAFVITARNEQVISIPWNDTLQNQLELFLKQCQYQGQGLRYQGHATAHLLYKQLFQPLKETLGDKNFWYILGDGLLNQLPFSALESKDVPGSYIGLEKNITYHYSINLLLQSGEKNWPLSSIAFAPFHEESPTAALPVLKESKEEVKTIGGNILLGSKAIKDSFLNLVGSYKLIHLATHAEAYNDNVNKSGIYFYPYRKDSSAYYLYLNEIYNLDLRKAELVILSACETAYGQNISGEGVMSMSRAFIYAGSKGIIATRWKTEDHVTAWIMQRLHQYLDNKKDPATALFLARKDFLGNKAFDSRFKTPNYWANFIYTGLPIAPGYDFMQLLFGTGMLFALIFIFYLILRMRLSEKRIRV